MTTLVGTFTLPDTDGTPETGYIHLSLASAAVYQDAPPVLVTPADIVCTLDEFGAFSAEVIPSDDALWATTEPVPYRVRVRLSGLRADYLALVPDSDSDVDLTDLVVIDGPPDVVAIPGPAPVITVDPDDVTATGLAHGEQPTAEITFTPGDPGEYALAAEFGLVEGAPGADAAEPNFTVTTTVVPVGGTPAATLSGTYPDLTIDVPAVTGATGPPGAGAGTVGNLLPDNVATATNALGTTAGFIARGTLASVVSAAATYGTRVLRLTVSGTTPRVLFGCTTNSGGVPLQGTIPVQPGQALTVRGRVRSDNTTTLSGLTVYFFQADGVTPSATPSAAGATSALTAAFSDRVVNTTVPADAAWCAVVGSMGGSVGAISEWEKFGVWHGVGGDWAPPGYPIVNMTVAQSNVTNLASDFLLKADKSRMGNLLPENVATGTDALGTTSGFGDGGSGTRSSSTEQAWQGTRSLKVVAAASNNGISLSGWTDGTGSKIEVLPGQAYSAIAHLWNAQNRAMLLRFYWWKADGSAASQSWSSGPSTTLSAAWTELTHTATAPADATHATVVIIASGVVAADVIYVDGCSFHRGVGGDWAPPGVPVVGQIDTATEAKVDEAVHLGTVGMDLLLFGDSITAADPGWVEQTTQDLQVTAYNDAVNGGTWRSKFESGDLRNLRDQITKAIDVSNRPADIVIVAAGTNDADTLNLGSYATAMSKATLADLDTSLAYEAVRWCMWKIRTQWPDAFCFAVLPIQRADRDVADDDIRQVIIEMARRHNFILIDGLDVPILREFETWDVEGHDLLDGRHPNADGNAKMSRLITARVISAMGGST